MIWKEQLKKLEDAKEWDFAIDLMQGVIAKNPDDMDAYMSMNYLLMNLLGEEQYDRSKYDYYADLLEVYFNESYAKFAHKAEYLFYMGKIAYIAEEYFGLELDDAKSMLYKAMHLEPGNILYQDTYYTYLDLKDPDNKKEALYRAKIVLEENSPIKKMLQEKGSMGKYIFGIMVMYSYRLIYGHCISDEEYARYMQ